MTGTPLLKHWKTAAMAAASYTGDSPLFVFDWLLRFLRVALLLSLWRTLFADRGAAAGLTLEQVLTYTLVAEVFAELLAVRTELMTALWEGTVATYFLRPVGLVAQFTADAAGRWLFGFGAFSLPLLALSPLLGVNPLPASLTSGLFFVVSLGLAVAVGLALEFIAGALMAAAEQNVWFLQQIRAAVGALLSGAVIPLALLPWGLGGVFEWLPFASMASAPLRIYVGAGDAAFLLPLQAFWALVLWPLAGWLWRVNRQRIATHGG